MSPTVISVLICHNRPRVALEALASIAAQIEPPDRFIIVDDGSTDGTADAIAAWLAEHPLPYARLVRQANAGPAAARNRGVREAGPCDVITFLDDDDLWPTDYIHRVRRAFADHPDAVAGSCDRLDVDQASRKANAVDLSNLAGSATRVMLCEAPPGTPNTAFAASAFADAGGFNEADRIGEDYGLMLRVSTRGRWLHIPGVPVTIRRFGLDTHLSHRFDDRRYRLAQVLQRFLDEGGSAIVERRWWRRRMGRLWYAAGRQLRRGGRTGEAIECFSHARSLLPWHLRAHGWWLMLKIFKGRL